MISQLKDSQVGGILPLLQVRGWGGKSCFPLRLSTDWMGPTHIKKGNLIYISLQIQMLTSSRNTPTDTPRIMFEQMSRLSTVHSS